MKAVRRIPSQNHQERQDHPDRKTLYLTFDDGPEPGSTEAVLELLARHQARATFFVIGEKARKEAPLFHRIRAEGHAIGNHSLDHGYSNFFRGKRALGSWIRQSEAAIQALQGGTPTVGFRPPAGVRTPELHAALSELGIPLILWSTRFFDTRFRWTQAKALRSLRHARSGDIVLLHDAQPEKNLPGFIQTLDTYLSAGREMGFDFGTLEAKHRMTSNFPI